ncbi:hypothetical protein PG988_009997 [Apiospora saccharicola]
MEYAAQLYSAAEALAAELKRTQSDPEKLKRVCDDKDRLEYEAWKAAGSPDMEAKNGDELREWRDVGFPAWFTVKSLKTFEPVKKQKSSEKGTGNPVVPGDTSGSFRATPTSADVMLKTALGVRKHEPSEKCAGNPFVPGNPIFPGDTSGSFRATPTSADVMMLKTALGIRKQEPSDKGTGNPVVLGDTSGSSKVTSTSADVMVKTAFGTRKAIASTPLPPGKETVLGGGPRVEYTFDDAYRQDQKAYMKANGLKGLSASRWA